MNRTAGTIGPFGRDEVKECRSEAGITGKTGRSARVWARAVRGSFGDFVARLAQGRFRRMVGNALALTPRGFIPHDVLLLTRLSLRLQVEWRTRDVHPWDRDLDSDHQAELFREQALRDTDAAISRLFQTLPDLDAIEIRVCEPNPPNRVILAGTVVRQDALTTRSLSSPAMRLRLMGVRWHVNGAQLIPLD